MKTPIKTLIKEFGLTHQQIADFLGIDRSIVSRMQTGDRPLPGKAAGPASLLIKAMQQIQQKGPRRRSARKVNLPLRIQVLQEQIVHCQIQIRQLEQELISMKQQENCCDNAAMLVKHLQPMRHACITARHTRWLEETGYQAKQHAGKCNAEQQWCIALKLKALTAQQTFYKDQLTVIKNQINNP